MDFKKILRIILLAFLLALALCGIGVVPPRPTRDYDNEVKIELVEDRNEDEETSSEAEEEKRG
jgi:hypothetical protein